MDCAQDAPDLLYSQCITHPYLGYKLAILDNEKVDKPRLQDASGSVELGAPQSCKTVFKGEEKTCRGCRKQLSADVDLYWTLNETEGEIETLFRALTKEGYVSFGCAYRCPMGKNVIAAFRHSTGEAAIDNYLLSAQSSSGVQTAWNHKLISKNAAIDGNFVDGMFNQMLEVWGLPEIENGKTGTSCSVDDKPSPRTTLSKRVEQADRGLYISVTMSSVLGQQHSETESGCPKPASLYMLC